ncbi:retrovirus-related Pol polyprotein from transposon 297 [Trichonephila clavipes]|nr:retrovirus-related Pol polyprotein from transposon 297 [Trichonephila clavipes]
MTRLPNHIEKNHVIQFMKNLRCCERSDRLIEEKDKQLRKKNLRPLKTFKIQVDPKKPFIIRTDASSYALGAVLLQGESPTDEQPVEYASRLLSFAEKKYSTTEREALAIVWALNKFRGYIEGAEITVASDHQPLKWLMNLTSPTGRFARASARDGHFKYNLTI